MLTAGRPKPKQTHISTYRPGAHTRSLLYRRLMVYRDEECDPSIILSLVERQQNSTENACAHTHMHTHTYTHTHTQMSVDARMAFVLKCHTYALHCYL